MRWKGMVAASLGLVLLLAVAVVARPVPSMDGAVPDEVAAQVKGGDNPYCGAMWDYAPSPYACYAPCTSCCCSCPYWCPKYIFACAGNTHAAVSIPLKYWYCNVCTCGSNCGGCSLNSPQGCY
jgi:hypothetical protein